MTVVVLFKNGQFVKPVSVLALSWDTFKGQQKHLMESMGWTVEHDDDEQIVFLNNLGTTRNKYKRFDGVEMFT